MVEGNISVGSVIQQPILQQEFLRWLSDPDTYFIWKQHTLHGDVLVKDDNNKEKWELPRDSTGAFLPAQMTEEGAINITNMLRDYLNQFGFHAQFKTEEIEQRELPTMDLIDIYFKRNQRAFGISDANLDMVCAGFKKMVDIAMHIDLISLYENVMKIGIGTAPSKEQGKVLGIFPSAKA